MHVKPHAFRRFVGTELARCDLRQAQRALGHKRLETTVQHYVLDEMQPARFINPPSGNLPSSL